MLALLSQPQQCMLLCCCACSVQATADARCERSLFPIDVNATARLVAPIDRLCREPDRDGINLQ